MEDEDEERQRKIAQGGALLAEYRERQARREGKKKKSVSKSKQDVHSLKINQQSNETSINSSQCVESAENPDSTKMRAGQIEKQNEVFVKDPHGERREPAPESCHMPSMPVLHTHIKSIDVIQPEGEISSLADNHSSLEEEEFDNCSQQGALSSQTCLEMMENELAGKQLTIEELTEELEERRATCGPEVMQRLYEFEAAVKQRDCIITQLIANLQQANKEKDETMREFSELTEQSQKLQIQFQHLQASETLRSNTHSSTATELLHVKQQVMAQQQQLEEQDRLLKDHQKKEKEFKIQITVLQEKIKVCEMEQDKKVESANNKIEEKQAIIEALNTRLIEEEKKTAVLTNRVTTADQLVGDLKGQLVEKDQETKSLKLELANSKQKVEQSSIEMKQYMETIEELQKKNYEVNFSETGIMQKMEKETEQKLAQLQAELDEEYGKQIVQMKQELIKQHMNQIEDLKSQHKGEMENTLKSRGNPAVNDEQVKLLSATMNELNMKVQHTLYQKEKFREELRVVKLEKCALQSQSNALLEELSALRDQIQRAKQTISEQESKLNEAGKSLSMVEDLKAEVTAAFESRKELELKHEAEITNYKIKLEMLEKEKNAVLDKMAESQEAELDRLRTQLLFSHEEELSKLKEDLEVEHRLNIEKLKDNLGLQYKMQIDDLQNEMSKKMETMQCEKDSLLSKQSQLILEITDLKDLQESRNFQMNEIKKEIETLRQEEKEKGTLEQEIQELQLKTEQLEKILKAKEEDLQEKCVELEAENSILKDEKKVLEDMVKVYTPVEEEEKLIALASGTYTSKDCSWQKEIDMLRKEKEDLKQQCIHLSKEIEMQRNTFSFAEKNFEVNYQELQEEYACLLKTRDIQTKQALEYEHKVKALTEELQLQRGGRVMQEGRHSQVTDAATFIAEPLEVRELVEKDNIEFMEKLKVTEQEKLELSEKLSVLSEQLKQTRDEVNCLSAEVKLLSQDKEELLLRCRELEVPTNPKGIENAAVCPAQLSSWKTELTTGTDAHSGGCDSKISKDLPEESKIMIEDKIPFKGSGEDLRLPTRTTEPSHGIVEPFEKEKLEQELCALKSTQDDLRLQMEAQRICLSLVYSAHADQVREYMEKQRDEALCSLRDELVSAQEKKMDELQKMHQCQLQALQTQETGGHKEPLPVLIGRLEKAVSEECCSISESLNSFLDEHYTPLKCEMNIEEKENSNVYNQNRNLKLQEYRYQVQDFQGHVQTLLSKLSDEYSKLVVLQTRLSKDENDTQNVDERTSEETILVRKPEDATTDVNLCNERVCIDSVVFKESDTQEAVFCGNCLNEHSASTTECSDGFEGRQERDITMMMEKQYQERLEEEIAKVIVSMSIAFAQQTELTRLSQGETNSLQSEQARAPCSQEHPFNDITSQAQLDPQSLLGIDKNLKEQFKPLSNELEEHKKEVPLSNRENLEDESLKLKDQGLTISQNLFSKDETITGLHSIHDEVSDMETCRQLEDMRQELVRQYEEHQQATELMRQAHVQQMERQREDQEQLREEIKRLSEQLAESSSLCIDSVVSERERVLLEELEALRQLSVAGRERLCCELRHSSTQTQLTQDENDTQNVDEHTSEETILVRKPEDATTDVNLCNERHALQKANSRLLKILLEVANTTAAVEETIGSHVFKILDRSSKAQPAPSLPWRTEADLCAKPGFLEEYGRVTDESLPSYPGNAISRNDGKWSHVTDKESDLSQQFGTSNFAGPEVDPENVQFMLNVSSRLQAAVEKLLEAISETSSQLEHAKVTQTQLVCETVRQKQEAEESLRCIEELQERLQDESSAREQLAVELNRAENIIDGYSDEKLAFEREIQEKSYVIDHLEQQLLHANQRLQELEAEQQQVQEERELLSRQKAAMREMAGPVEQRPINAAVAAAPGGGFLQETEKLMKEKLQVQCQAEKVHSELQNQVKILEIDVEEKISKLIEMEQEKNAEVTDLRQQNQALEKQLENLRKFVDEQTVDREHERDIFQMEIQKLEQQIKVVPRPQPGSEQQAREIEKLTGHLKEKADQCSELLLCKEQLQRDVQDRDAEIEKLQCRRQELEHALLVSAESTAEINNQKQSGGVEIEPGLSLEVQLQAERDAIDRKEKEISNLEEQLEQFREELENKNDEVQELHMQLEIQRKESTTRLQELQQENKLYQDEMQKLEFIVKESDPTPLPDQPTLFGKFAQIIQEKDAKIDQLNEQLAKVHHQLKLATTDKEASSTPGMTYSNAQQTRDTCSSDSDSELDQAFDIASEGQEECESSPVVPKGLLRAVHTEGIQMLSIADLPDDDGQDPSKGTTEYQVSMECVQSREEEADTASQELLDCSMQQSGKLETKEQPCGMKDQMAKLQEQLSSEKTVVSKLKYALSRTQLELEATLKVQHKHIKDLEAFRLKVQDKVDDVHLPTDTLENEQMKSQEHQCALATEKAKSGHSEEQDEELKDLRFILEDQKQRNIHLDTLLGQQKQLLDDLQEKMESQKILHNAQLSEEQGRNIMLQVLLESEKVRIRELKESLDKERELHAQLKNRGDDLQPQPAVPPAELLQYLQEQVEEKQKRIIELVNESQKYKLDSLETKYQMEKDRQIHQKTLQLEKEANNLGQRKMEELQGKVEELQLQLEEKRHQVHKLDLEGKRLQAIMQEFQNQELGQEEKRRSKRLVYQNINEEATWNVTDDRTRNWVLQQKMEETKNTSYAKVIETNGGAIVSYNDVHVIRQKLQHLATKLQLHIAQKACNRQEFEVSDEDVLNWVRERIDRLILRVQRLTSCPHEHGLLPSSTSCTETILRQISEVTGHVNQLTEEKNNLRNIIMQLEEQIKFYQQTSADRNCFSRFSFDGSASIKDIIASEKEVWSNEKLTLQKSLQRAEAKVCRLKDELKNDTLHQNRSPENAVFKRIYGKYLRAESFRKALVFQKKYLLLLLGRFQECEEATVGLLFHMTGFPGFRNPETGTSRPKGLAIFRKAVRVSIAITRMKYLVRRWHRVKASGPNNVNRDGFGVGPGVERTDPLYHSTSGLELYPDPRQMTHYSSRSDLDFPRSPLPFNRYPGTLVDFNPALTNPQLQQYNPGRTLTDYVTQIDALQRRLGTTLQSGSPASQYQTGMRR
ncbi:A-kinase anchor protein 9-like isoform X3 [Microtus oregoni]|uniref:A-kinase anchor protein 9-like isoform X3 n=1 Tax=Microtus oregoni TaxID=111838 RepID=UPI001BB1D937|nr:A-kinase anchor protein 9-like isoform X3 [Microtus oregoni]